MGIVFPIWYPYLKHIFEFKYHKNKVKKKKIVIEEFSLQSIPVDAKDDITKTSPYEGVTRDILG